MKKRVCLQIVLLVCTPGCFPEFGEYTSTEGGNLATGGSGGSSNMTTSSSGGSGGASPGSGGAGGGGGCDTGFADCDADLSNGCEASLLDDVDSCGGCITNCPTITGSACNDGICEGPCGPVPQTGTYACWVYGKNPVLPSEYVGLAGGTADPDIGETIENKYLDPWSGCVNPNPGKPFVLCDLGNPDPNWNIQFRAGLHLTTGVGASAGTWDCSDTLCTGDVYAYDDGIEIGSLVDNVELGALSTIRHFVPPRPSSAYLNAKVTMP